MEYNDIKILLDKYLAGETSLEEEKLLGEYYAKPDVHADFAAFKPLFDYFSSEKNLTTSEGFEEKILSKIKEETAPAKTFKLYWLRVAAVVLLLLGSAGIIYKSVDKNKIVPVQNVAEATQINNSAAEITDTYSNPEDAKKAVEQALALLSKHLNKGENIAERNIGKMDVLNKALDN
ncbi:hypothetical protein A9P82_12490 [Arachidicoccus ginsenosidimutans]|uniref:hypothetical protein n=1 Tax=Arachidicoccus sp. BS20 TaxID=1850526 RepID=UPI0007F0D621|nr:hypothetical protein [Arachidicoccus sp. BS20]ANI90027.1 hypothetical protein A9P82_12490 [Arachidicoccus sp. BS20]